MAGQVNVIPQSNHADEHIAFQVALIECLSAAKARREAVRRAMVDMGPVVYFVRFGSLS